MTSSIVLEVPKELELRLREKAIHAGLQFESFVSSILEKQLMTTSTSATRLSKKESALLLIINKGFSSNFWAEYDELIKKRQNESLSEQEYIKLNEFSDKVEIANAERMKALFELAKIRKTPIERLIEDLEIKPYQHV